MRLHNPSLKQVEEYSWMQEFEGRRIPIKVRVYFTPFDFGVGTGKATGKYNASVFIGGKCYPFVRECPAGRSAPSSMPGP